MNGNTFCHESIPMDIYWPSLIAELILVFLTRH